MPEFCAAYSCSNRRTVESKARGITFHKFPRKDMRKKWERALRRKDFTATNTTVLCSEHFKPEDFDRTGQIVRLRDGVIPSIFSFPVKPQKVSASKVTPRFPSPQPLGSAPPEEFLGVLRSASSRMDMMCGINRARLGPTGAIRAGPTRYR
uniref:THAP-type domain-containing protein n=1 Tax=Nothobranchius furzeri TaxID=105023 RepID=A0A8C6P0D9_NOTFU